MASGAPFPLAGELAALVSSVLWAGAGIVFRTMRGRVPPVAVNLAKNATASVGLVLVLWIWQGSPWPTAMPLDAQAILFLSGILGLTICDTYFLRAMMEIGPRRATLVMLLAPVLIFLGALLPPFSQLDRVAHAGPWIGLALAVAGVWLATGEVSSGDYDPAHHRRGVRDALLAALFQAIGFLLARLGFDRGADPIPGAAVRLVAGTVGLLLVGLLTRRLVVWGRALSAPGIAKTLAITAFFGTFLGIGLNQCGIAWGHSTGAVAVVNSLSPVWLIPLSTIWLGEKHGPRAWLSTLLALCGVALLSL